MTRKALGVVLVVLVVGGLIAIGPARDALSTAKSNEERRPAGAVTPTNADRDARALFGGDSSALFDEQVAGGTAVGPEAGIAFGMPGFRLPGLETGSDRSGAAVGSAFDVGPSPERGRSSAPGDASYGVYGFLASPRPGGGSGGDVASSPGAADGVPNAPTEDAITTPADTAVAVPAPGALGLLAIGLLGVAAAAGCRRSETCRG